MCSKDWYPLVLHQSLSYTHTHTTGQRQDRSYQSQRTADDDRCDGGWATIFATTTTTNNNNDDDAKGGRCWQEGTEEEPGGYRRERPGVMADRVVVTVLVHLNLPSFVCVVVCLFVGVDVVRLQLNVRVWSNDERLCGNTITTNSRHGMVRGGSIGCFTDERRRRCRFSPNFQNDLVLIYHCDPMRAVVFGSLPYKIQNFN
jgi:hypothetical protein